jgi:predicted  nucleic acid-binding Zn-ribbon protein
LEREETAVHDTLSAQTIALGESQASMSSVEKAFLAAKLKLDAAKAAKAATEMKLEEVRSEVAKNKTFEKDFDAFQA